MAGRKVAGLDQIDARKLGDRDTPESDWGQPAGEGAVYSANHAVRTEHAEGKIGQGAKTRRANKDIVSRRA